MEPRRGGGAAADRGGAKDPPDGASASRAAVRYPRTSELPRPSTHARGRTSFALFLFGACEHTLGRRFRRFNMHFEQRGELTSPFCLLCAIQGKERGDQHFVGPERRTPRGTSPEASRDSFRAKLNAVARVSKSGPVSVREYSLLCSRKAEFKCRTMQLYANFQVR